MSLEINKNDQTANLKELKHRAGATVKRGVAGLLTIMLFSGSGYSVRAAAAQTPQPSSSMSSVTDQDLDRTINIPEAYQSTVALACHKKSDESISISDLEGIKSLWLSVAEGRSLEWLNNCSNMNSFSANCLSTDPLKDYKGSSQLKSIFLASTGGTDISIDDFEFLKSCPNLESLSLLDFDIEPGFLESIPTHIKELSLRIENNCQTDFSKFTFLDTLEFPSQQSYTLATFFTKQEYDTLVQAGVKVKILDEENFFEANRKLDAIVSSLNLSSDSTDQEKLDAILIYTLDNLTYDEEISRALKEGIDHADKTRSFYERGTLYGALEKDSAICGNYAALVQALAKRVGLSTYYLESNNHAWNLVTVEGVDYYVDATWLDGQSITVQNEPVVNADNSVTYSFSSIDPANAIKDGKTDELSWYMEDPTNYPESVTSRESHDVINLPSFISLKPIPKQETITDNEIINDNTAKDTTEKQKPLEITDEDKFEVSIGTKTWIIGGAAAVGILSAVGAAIAVTSKKKKEQARQRRLSDQYGGFTSDGSVFDDIFPPTSSSYDHDSSKGHWF